MSLFKPPVQLMKDWSSFRWFEYWQYQLSSLFAEADFQIHIKILRPQPVVGATTSSPLNLSNFTAMGVGRIFSRGGQ